MTKEEEMQLKLDYLEAENDVLKLRIDNILRWHQLEKEFNKDKEEE